MATTGLGLPYPVGGDTPNVPRDIKALADKVDELLQPKDAPGAPYGGITHGSTTAVTSVGMTPKKVPFTGRTASVQGGVAWDSAKAAFTGPAGFYHVALRACVYPSGAGKAGPAAVEMGMGTSAGYGSAYGGGSVPENVQTFLHAGGVREMAAGADFSFWVRSSSVRNIGYVLFVIHYLGPRETATAALDLDTDFGGTPLKIGP